MGLLSEMKLELITAPVVALYSPTRLLRLLATKRLLPRSLCLWGAQPRNEAGVNRCSRSNIVLANGCIALLANKNLRVGALRYDA